MTGWIVAAMIVFGVFLGVTVGPSEPASHTVTFCDSAPELRGCQVE